MKKNNKTSEALMSETTNEEKIKIMSLKNIVKILGVCASPSLSWKDEFECAKKRRSLSEDQ